MTETIDFGIDLGTTNSAIAKYIKGRVEIFKDPSTWKDTVPSVVGYRKDRILIGNAARVYQERDPKNVVGQFKRKMGTTEVFRLKGLDDPITPVELSSHILKSLKSNVQTGEKIDSAVITIPGSFDIVQSNATKQAGIEAGLSEVVLLQEPIAASLAYANSAGKDLKDCRWLVYDLGGGTFDVALVNIIQNELKVIDHEGDNNLGGADFDRLIVESFVIPHINENCENVELARDFQSASGTHNTLFLKLLRLAEEAKIKLSNDTSADIDFEFDDSDVTVEITRSEFESILREQIDKTVEMVRKIMTRNKLTAADIDFVLMVGGSTFIPYVRMRVSELLGVDVKTDIDPTTAIAIGAAYFAGTKERSRSDESIEQKSNSLISIKAVYEKATKESSEYFAARITGDTTNLSYRIRRGDGGFDTGLRQLGAKISEDLPLVSESLNDFVFEIFDTYGNKVATNLTAIRIAQNIFTIAGQPLTQDLCLELDDLDNETSYLKPVFTKGSILPTKSGSIMVKANRNVSHGSSDQFLRINVYEGSMENLPESNKLIGSLSICGSNIDDDIIKGSDIEIRFELSESRDVTVSAYIEHLDKAISQIFRPTARNVNLDGLQLDLKSLCRRAVKEIEAAGEREDNTYVRELNGIYREIDKLEDQVIELSDDDVTDQKLQFDDEMRRLATDLNNAILERQADRLTSEYFENRSRCEALVGEQSNPRFLELFAEIVKDEKRFTQPPIAGILKSKINDLENLYWHVKWRTPEYLTDRFNSLVEREDDSTDLSAYQGLIEEGQLAVINSNYDKLREIIFRMFDLLPSAARVRFGKTGISI